jgi:sialic acid synthase SpsE/CMP-N-acetylneuraminic acid synthetase
MVVLGVILARAGSKGLPDKCLRSLLGKPVLAYTLEHAAASRRLTDFVLSTDSEPAKQLARQAGVNVIDRPPELATDTATVDAAARHAVQIWESQHDQRADIVVLLYGNIAIRTDGLIDRAVDHLVRSGADSVRSVAPVTKQHPDWVHRLDGDRMIQYRPNSIYRRQDLEPLYYHDGAVAAVTREALFDALRTPNDHQAFLSQDRRAIVQRPDEAVDIDEPIDLYLAEALLRAHIQRSATPVLHQSRGRQPADPAPEPPGKRQILQIKPQDEALPDHPCVPIGPHSIGPGHPVFIVAEAGVNHNGSLQTALDLVDAAAEAGADAVKFQIFRASDLVTAEAPTARYQKTACGADSQRDMLERLELPDRDWARIQERCQRRSILFLATPFAPDDVKRLNELDVAAIKIASTDCTNLLLLRAAAATGRPLIVSTGAATETEIRETAAELRRLGAADRLILLHCISCYPTPVEALNLKAMQTLAQSFGVPVGLSDHTQSVETGGWAVAAGACVLEKHFTLDRSAEGPDHAMSLSPDELRQYIRRARDAQAALGSGIIGLTAAEGDVRRIAGRSIIAAVDIPAGAMLDAAKLAVKRPGGGMSPAEWDRLIGRQVRVGIPADTALTWDMLQ